MMSLIWSMIMTSKSLSEIMALIKVQPELLSSIQAMSNKLWSGFSLIKMSRIRRKVRSRTKLNLRSLKP